MFVLLLLLFIVVPIAEIYVIVQVGEAIGAPLTVLLLLCTSLLGAFLVRSQGRSVWRRFRTTLAAGRAPTREIVDGALVLAGGTLLMIPGFITDVIGALMLLPPTRMVLRRGILRGARGRLLMRVGGVASRRAPRQHYDVDATAHDIDSRRLQG